MTSPLPYADIQDHLEENLADYLDLLRRMVAINSFTANPNGVAKLAELTAASFAELGFEAEYIQAADYLYSKHLILSRPARTAPDGRPAATIGLISHLDTVFPAEEEIANDFHWREDGDLIYGPGTVDIKGGTVVAFMILDALRQFAPDLYDRVNWKIMLNAAEEVLSFDFGDLCRDHLDSALAALVFEGGSVKGKRLNLVTSRKGMARYRIAVEGRASHAGAAHEKGANAIVQLADVIHQVALLTDYEHDLTFNVGTVEGGTVVNRVPHQASANVEMRAYTPDVFDDGVAGMMALNNYCSVLSHHDGFPCQSSVILSQRWEPWPVNAATEALLAQWQEAAAELGYKVKGEARGGLSDGNLIWETIPTIDGLGPAGGNAHSSQRSDDGTKDQEFARRSSFVPKALTGAAGIARIVADYEAGASAD